MGCIVVDKGGRDEARREGLGGMVWSWGHDSGGTGKEVRGGA